MRAALIVLIALAATIAYGVVHDLFTAHACVEYFTVAHPRLIASQDPVVLALFWGVVATWWVGLPLGIALAVCARAGNRPPVAPSRIIRPLGIMLAGLLAIAGLAWIVGYASGRLGWLRLMPPWDARIPMERHAAFLGDVWAHLASYFFGILGGILLCMHAWRSRGATRGGR